MTEDQALELIEREADRLARDIVEGWRQIGRSDRWLALPEPMDMDHLPGVLRSLAGAARGSEFQAEDCRRVIADSAVHGEHRRKQGFQEQLLYTEYTLLRRSLWDLLRDRVTETHPARAITRVDALLSLATLACLRGYHRESYEARGEWPEALEGLLDEWPLAGSL